MIAPAVGVSDFEVELNGATVPILEARLQAANMGEDADDPEESEYLARVRWIDTRPREKGVWEKGMFANQNVVAKLRQPFTLQRLSEAFDADDPSLSRGSRNARGTKRAPCFRYRFARRRQRADSERQPIFGAAHQLKSTWRQLPFANALELSPVERRPTNACRSRSQLRQLGEETVRVRRLTTGPGRKGLAAASTTPPLPLAPHWRQPRGWLQPAPRYPRRRTATRARRRRRW